MKKTVYFLMVITLLFSLAACGNNANNEESSSLTPQSSEPSSSSVEEQNAPSSPTETPVLDTEPTETGSKSLVVYFSWSGNTENVAKAIQKQTDSDIFEIVPATPYSDDYDTVLDVAKEEQRNDARPAIADNITNMADYDVIYVGYPKL
ncbi:flavodoxin [Hominifimenecus sp. rT4P-3]|uniref:flavodoxin n=1 Tax=Hominifimenecus sp. rT4P-3 TaxID=3242979 RepID=UPI003DA3DBDF